ncbi:MAG: heavy metal translocating P-type ATPase metal-binding domain-containing protein, partial [Candidatus Kapabacteria bacterium]|nr:heavy metal translocating P-type ATPase metal-binding domain-containing protein [Candidatus Kapabacteria bacterium]
MTRAEVVAETKCFHCGENCGEVHWRDDKPFCCKGCETVYEILDSSNLCEYYTLNQTPGTRVTIHDTAYAYLDEGDLGSRLLTFDSSSFSSVTFFIPSIHCVSCIWLLENLSQLHEGIIRAEVNFAKKTVQIDFNKKAITLGTLAGLLASVGYAPRITLEQEKQEKPRINRSLVLKLAVAGFCFGNVMLFSFPEYLGIDQADHTLIHLFSWLNLALAISVLFYCGIDYLRAAVRSFQQKQINIDVPIAAGLLALFFRSSYDIISGTGAGYLDSFTGLVFFLLIGRWFQSKTYESLAFDRDFKSYFPLAVHRLEDNEWKPVVIYHLVKGDTIRIRNLELVPTDSILLEGTAYID